MADLVVRHLGGNFVRPLIPTAYRPETYLPVKVPGLGLIIAFVALTVLGFFTSNPDDWMRTIADDD